jgi:hypothetical protein
LHRKINFRAFQFHVELGPPKNPYSARVFSPLTVNVAPDIREHSRPCRLLDRCLSADSLEAIAAANRDRLPPAARDSYGFAKFTGHVIEP